MADVDELREDVQEARDLVRATTLHEVIYNRMVWQDQSMTLQDAKAGLLMLAAPLLLLATVSILGSRLAIWQLAGGPLLALLVIAYGVRVLGPWKTQVAPNPNTLYGSYHDAATADTLMALAASHVSAFEHNAVILAKKAGALRYALGAMLLLVIYIAACIIVVAAGEVLHG